MFLINLNYLRQIKKEWKGVERASFETKNEKVEKKKRKNLSNKRRKACHRHQYEFFDNQSKSHFPGKSGRDRGNFLLWSSSKSIKHMVGQRRNQRKTDWKECSLRVGNRLKKKNRGSSIVVGICNLRYISRHYIACFLRRELPECLEQDFNWPPGSQLSLQRTHMLL